MKPGGGDMVRKEVGIGTTKMMSNTAFMMCSAPLLLCTAFSLLIDFYFILTNHPWFFDLSLIFHGRMTRTSPEFKNNSLE